MSETPAFSAEIAELLVQATGIYLDLTADLADFLAADSPEDEQEIVKLTRRVGIEMAGQIAHANRMIDEGRIRGSFKVDASYDPRVVQPLLRILGDCFTLLLTAGNRDELRELPLIDPELLRRAVWGEQVYRWVERCANEASFAQLGLYASERAVSQITRAE